jgi:hypothetical protein
LELDGKSIRGQKNFKEDKDEENNPDKNAKN